MRALSLSQPWASVVVHGPKRIENRPLSLAGGAGKLVGHTIAVHAAKSWDADAVAFIAYSAPSYTPPDHARGALIGTARLVEVLTFRDLEAGRVKIAADQIRWAFGPLCIVLDQVAAIPTPIPCRGMLGFWTLPADLEAQLATQLEARK